MAMARETLTKTEEEVRILTHDFTLDMETGETITGLTVEVSPASGAPTFSGETFSGQEAQAIATGGTEGTYLVNFKVTTSAGETLDGLGYLEIIEGV